MINDVVEDMWIVRSLSSGKKVDRLCSDRRWRKWRRTLHKYSHRERADERPSVR